MLEKPFLSIVIPTFNRIDRIRRVLDALVAQEYPREAFEVIVISDGSTDGTNEYLQKLSLPVRLIPVFQSNRGPAAARNAGVSKASGDLIVFIDDDVVPAPAFLIAHVKAHAAAGRDVAVIGPLLTPSDFEMLPWVRWEQEMLVKQYSAILAGQWEPTARQFYTGNASVPRRLLLEVGGFDEQFRRAEDVEMAYRLAARGVGFVFTMEAEAHHYAERSYKSWLEAAYTYGKNDAIFARDRKQSWLLQSVRNELRWRKLPMRMLIRTCLGRPGLAKLVTSIVQSLAYGANRAGANSSVLAAYSCLFGLQYYQGFIDELKEPGFFSKEDDRAANAA